MVGRVKGVQGGRPPACQRHRGCKGELPLPIGDKGECPFELGRVRGEGITMPVERGSGERASPCPSKSKWDLVCRCDMGWVR